MSQYDFSFILTIFHNFKKIEQYYIVVQSGLRECRHKWETYIGIRPLDTHNSCYYYHYYYYYYYYYYWQGIT